MSTLVRPFVVSPFEADSINSSIYRFSTNMNVAEVTFRFSVTTAEIYLVFPSGLRERLTNSLDFYVLDELNQLTPISYGSGSDQYLIPLNKPLYAKLNLDLVPNQLNSVTVRVHDGNYDYNLLPTEFPNSGIRTEEINLLITQAPADSMGITVLPPTVLYTDFKDASVILNFRDNNQIDETPLGSGYKVYYTMEQNDRVGTYKPLNAVIVSDYKLEDVTQTVLRTDIFNETERIELDSEAPGSVFDYTFLESPAYKSEYYIPTKISDVDAGTSHTVDISGYVVTKSGVFDTSPFERVGTRVVVSGVENHVISWVEDVSVTFENLFTVSGSGIPLEIVGSRLRELKESAIKNIAQQTLIDVNTELTTTRYSAEIPLVITTGVSTVYTVNTGPFESEGLSVIFRDSNSILPDQVSQVSSWVSGVSVTFFYSASANYDTIVLVPSLDSESDCIRYTVYLNNLLVQNSVSGADRDNVIYDINICILKHKIASTLYTERYFSDEVYQQIDTANMIVANYPEMSDLYTYGFVKEVFNSDNYYTLQQEVVFVLGEPVVEYYYQVKSYLSIDEADDYDGLYLTQQSFHKTPLYTKTYYREIAVDVEAIIRTQEFDRLLNLEIVSTMLSGADVLDPNLLIFFIVSFIYKDSARKILIESAYSKEVFGSVLTIDLEEQRPSLITQADIQRQLIGEINEVEPDLDLKPGAITRSVFINPFSAVVENLSFREYFREVSQSFVTLLEFDGLDSNGESIPVEDSILKVQLRTAYGLDDSTASNELIQEYVNSRFDLLASNFGVVRGEGRYARGEILLSAPSLPQDPQAVILAKGSFVSTDSPELDFVVLSEIQRDSFSSVKNQQGLFTARAFIRSASPGTQYLVPANSIIKVSGAFISGLKVTNPYATFGGKDFETNLQLVEAVRRKLLSIDTGTVNGYLQKIAFLGTVERAKIVTSGHPYMRRDFDFVLGRAGHNAVDVYIKGLYPLTYTQNSGLYYNKIEYLQCLFDPTPRDLGNGVDYYSFNLSPYNLTLKDKYLDIFELLRVSIPFFDSTSFDYTHDVTLAVMKDRFEVLLPYAGNELLIDALLNNSVIDLTVYPVFLECSFRQNFIVPFENKPYLSVASATDSFGNSLYSDLNYIPFNKSRTLVDRGSLVEDSGMEVLVSPLDETSTDEFEDDDAIDGTLLVIPDGYYAPVPYIQDPNDVLFRYTARVDFEVKEIGKYFYIRVPAGSLNILNNTTYTIFYGPYYSLSKDIRVVHDTDILVDLKIYTRNVSVVYQSGLNEVVAEEVTDPIYASVPYSFMVYRGNGYRLYVILLQRDLITYPDDTIEVTSSKNLAIGYPIQFNQPSFSDLNSDYNVALISGIEYQLTKRGVDPASIVIRPATELEVDLEPYVAYDDYRVEQRGDRTYISVVPTGNIPEAQSVSIEYSYANELRFNISYDAQVAQVTEYLENFAHAGSNFLVYTLSGLKVVIKAVVFINNVNLQSAIDSEIRSRIFRYVSQLNVGASLYESDVIGIIENVPGVRNLKVKLASLSLKEGEVSYFEKLQRSDFSLYQTGYVDSYYTQPNYVNAKGELVSLLNYTPLANGGLPDRERAVLIDNYYYEIVDSPDQVAESLGRAHISSSGSVYISFFDPEADDPSIEVTYQVKGSVKAKDIIVFPFQYIEIDTLDLVFEVVQ